MLAGMSNALQPVPAVVEPPIPLSKLPAEIEALTGVRPHLATVHRWKNRRKFATRRVGDRVYVDRAELRRFLNEGNATAAGSK